ncbi:MAG: hypothetical protein ABL967_07345 [Bryobacteraceae bacterium]
MNQPEIQKLLEALADHDRGMEAGVRLEAAVLDGFRRRSARLRYLTWAAWGLPAAAVGIVLLIGLWRTPVRNPRRSRPATAETIVPVIPQREASSVNTAIPGTNLAHTPRIQARRPVNRAPVQASESIASASNDAGATHEFVTDFYPLLEPVPPMEHAAILRMRVPASAMQAVGFPVGPERWDEPVQADVLVGEEGMARAIRFVTFTTGSPQR